MGLTDNLSLSEYYDNKRILITGASGYISWNLIRSLSEYSCTIVYYSRNIEKIERHPGEAKFEFIKASYQDETAFQKAVKNVDIIYHLASQTSAYEAEKNPLGDYEANVRPMQLLLEACRKENRCPIIIFSGTSTQCGIPEKFPVNENAPDYPITTYDFHKLQAESWLKFYTRQNWVKGVSLRLTNVYGPGPKSSSEDRGILNLMIHRALKGDELTIYGTGEYLRDYIYIYDVVSAFLSVPININKTANQHYLLGSGAGTKLHDAIKIVGEIVKKHTGKKITIKNIKPPNNLLSIEFRNFVADINSLTSLTGNSIQFTLEKGILRTLKFYLNSY